MKGVKSKGSNESLVDAVRVFVPKAPPSDMAGPSLHHFSHVVLKKKQQNHWPRSGPVLHHPCVPREKMHKVTFSSEIRIETPKELLFIKCPRPQNWRGPLWHPQTCPFSISDTAFSCSLCFTQTPAILGCKVSTLTLFFLSFPLNWPRQSRTPN